jgi:hypothetical protein
VIQQAGRLPELVQQTGRLPELVQQAGRQPEPVQQAKAACGWFRRQRLPELELQVGAVQAGTAGVGCLWLVLQAEAA